jgi:alpha-glucosidase
LEHGRLGDFHWGQWSEHPSDPPYFSTPYLAVKSAAGWIGLLLHNPGTTFIETPGRDDSRVFVEWQRTSPHIVLGSENGEPHLWVIVAESLQDLTRKFQSLIGRTPLPPLWSLGFHQSRWGYGGDKDLKALDRKFTKMGVPCSGLWLDLDYMRGFRIFDVDQRQFPRGVKPVACELAESGRRIVPIIDPGVKAEAGYAVFDDGKKHDVFCKNPEGNDYIGLVWPGETVFPDFTLARVRDWWAGYAAEFRASGFCAAWVDMNDPSTGPVDPTGMLFDEGRDAHALHRNQYAVGMQMATIAGFQRAEPDERPFLLSRSGWVGSSRYSAVWTGDNVSNDFYLRLALPTTLGLSISGLPFNGPDLGGFGGDATPELMARWLQACLLFPFYRNHSTLDSRDEEPWQYKGKARDAIVQSIRLRHQFLPYLYQLFCEQEESGDPVVRPLLYDFDDPALEELGDQFMAGPWAMQAPILDQSATEREVLLPGSEPWLDLASGKWRKPGRHKVKASLGESPAFLRAGALVPIQPILPTDNEVDLARPAFLVAAPPGWTGSSEALYRADDGLTFGYKRGERTTLRVSLAGDGEGLAVKTEALASGFGDVRPSFLVLGEVSPSINGRAPDEEPWPLRLFGKKLPFRRLS